MEPEARRHMSSSFFIVCTDELVSTKYKKNLSTIKLAKLEKIIFGFGKDKRKDKKITCTH